jgi:hypothetical protein
MAVQRTRDETPADTARTVTRGRSERTPLIVLGAVILAVAVLVGIVLGIVELVRAVAA